MSSLHVVTPAVTDRLDKIKKYSVHKNARKYLAPPWAQLWSIQADLTKSLKASPDSGMSLSWLFLPEPFSRYLPVKFDTISTFPTYLNIWDLSWAPANPLCNGIQIQYFFGYLRVILTSESTQKSTIRRHPFIHSFTK